MRPVLQCASFGDRTVDHPASPALVRGRGVNRYQVHLYLQHAVPSIGLDRFAPWPLYKDTTLLEPRSSLVRCVRALCALT
jgi:hypothetical protein